MKYNTWPDRDCVKMHVSFKCVIAFAELIAIREIVTVRGEAESYPFPCNTSTAAAAIAIATVFSRQIMSDSIGNYGSVVCFPIPLRFIFFLSHTFCHVLYDIRSNGGGSFDNGMLYLLSLFSLLSSLLLFFPYVFTIIHFYLVLTCSFFSVTLF